MSERVEVRVTPPTHTRRVPTPRLGRHLIDDREKRRLVVREAVVFCGMLLLAFCTIWLPHGDKNKEGLAQQLARFTCASFFVLLFASRVRVARTRPLFKLS